MKKTISWLHLLTHSFSEFTERKEEFQDLSKKENKKELKTILKGELE